MTEPADAIAIIGYAGRFPGAADVEQFWAQLRDGTDVRTDYSDDDLDRAMVPTEVRDRPGFVRSGYVLDDAYEFDADFFGMSPAEAALVDPQQRLFLECVWQAFEHAGHCPGGPVGVFAGAGLSGHLLGVLAHRAGTDLVASYQALTANDKDFLATRVSYKLGLTGPSIAVQSACSTSLVAVHLAAQSLLAGECDLAVAGGVSVMLPQRTGYVHQPGMILSPDGRCRPFDASAGGTVRGDGLGAVILRRLDEAVADGDTVHGVILGSAVNNDGADKLGFSATSVARQRDVVVQAHEVAGISADTVDYVETHGTGTELGDPAEVAALAEAFRRAPAGGSCVLGAVKANVGHLDAAAGMAGLIKVLLMLRHRQIPPVLHHTRLNPKIDLVDGRFQINTELRDWTGVHDVRRAGITSLGIGGTNAHLVVEQPPEPVPTTGSRPVQLLVLSARTRPALDAAARDLATLLAEDDSPELADVAYTSQVGRMRFAHRRFVRCRSRGEAVRLLGRPGQDTVTHQDNQHRPVVFLLPGQGAQRIGMGRLLAEREPVFRAAANEAAELLAEHLGVDVRTVLYEPPSAAAEDRLRQTAVAQAALFLTEYALATLLGTWGVRPSAMLGHSLGELVAACLAGVFTLPDAARLVARRGLLMQGLPGGQMLAVALPAAELAEHLAALPGGRSVDIAAVNGERDCVASGSPDAVLALGERLDHAGVDHRLLRTSHAFHSAVTEPILDEFTELVRQAGPKPPVVPFVSNLTGDWITDGQATDGGYWAAQLRHTVLFHDGLGRLLTEPGTAVLEVGPGQALASLARRGPASDGHPVIGTLGGLARTKGNEHEAVIDAVGRLWAAGVDIDWSGFHVGERRRRVPLPSYPFQRHEYRLDLPALTGPEPAARWTRPQVTASTAEPVSTPISESAGNPAVGSAEAGSAMAELVSAVWREVLGVTEVDPDGNFFDLGGDSLTGLRVIRALSDRSGIDLDPVDVFEAPTVRALAKLLAERGDVVTGGSAGEPTGSRPAGGLTVEERRAEMRHAAVRRRARTAGGVDEG